MSCFSRACGKLLIFVCIGYWIMNMVISIFYVQLILVLAKPKTSGNNTLFKKHCISITNKKKLWETDNPFFEKRNSIITEFFKSEIHYLQPLTQLHHPPHILATRPVMTPYPHWGCMVDGTECDLSRSGISLSASCTQKRGRRKEKEEKSRRRQKKKWMQRLLSHQ